MLNKEEKLTSIYGIPDPDHHQNQIFLFQGLPLTKLSQNLPLTFSVILHTHKLRQARHNSLSNWGVNDLKRHFLQKKWAYNYYLSANSKQLPCGEWTRRLIGIFEMPLFFPVTRSVSSSISFRTASKSVNIRPLRCRNSACSKEATFNKLGKADFTTCNSI